MPNETNETTKAKVEVEKIVHPAVIEFDNTKTFIAKAGSKKGATNRIEIVWNVPATDEEAQARYGKDLAFFVKKGIMEISHAPAYGTILTDDVYDVEKHKACQKLADDYKPGNRATGAGAQVKVDAAAGKAARASATALGFTTIEEALAFAAKAKAKLTKKKR